MRSKNNFKSPASILTLALCLLAMGSIGTFIFNDSPSRTSEPDDQKTGVDRRQPAGEPEARPGRRDESKDLTDSPSSERNEEENSDNASNRSDVEEGIHELASELEENPNSTLFNDDKQIRSGVIQTAMKDPVALNGLIAGLNAAQSPESERNRTTMQDSLHYAAQVAEEDIVVEEVACSEDICAARISSSMDFDRDYRMNSNFTNQWRDSLPGKVSGFVKSESEEGYRNRYTIFQILDDEIESATL